VHIFSELFLFLGTNIDVNSKLPPGGSFETSMQHLMMEQFAKFSFGNPQFRWYSHSITFFVGTVTVINKVEWKYGSDTFFNGCCDCVD